MCCTWGNRPGRGLVRFLVVCLSFSGAVFTSQPCKGDPSLPVIPQPIAWISGPATVSLGRNAELRVPSGYSFANEKGARAFIDGMRGTSPKGIVGALQPNSGAWWAMLEYKPIGYGKDEDTDQIDPDVLLTKLSEEVNRQQSKPQAVTWERKPDYDPVLHSLEWAVRISSEQNETSIRQTLRLLGRHGVLDAVVNRPARESSDLMPLKNALKDVSFKDGERYAEYKSGDKIAGGGLAGLVTFGKPEPQEPEKPRVEATSMKTFWIGMVAVFCVGFVGTVVMVRKIKNSRTLAPVVEMAKEIAFPPQPVAAPVQAVPKPAVVPKPIAAKPVNGTKPHHIEKPKPVVKANGHHSKTKRKVFNYQKFYTEMVLSSPTPSLTAEVNGYELELNRMAGHTAPDNHHHHHHQNGKQDPSAVTVNSELISNQRSIIEEQKRLIHEQAKLIEEKTRLIAEKNQLLQRQSEMIANNLL